VIAKRISPTLPCAFTSAASHGSTTDARARPTGEAFTTPNHPYAGDLDLFVPIRSFVSRSHRDEIRRLALGILAQRAIGDFPNGVRERQEARARSGRRYAFASSFRQGRSARRGQTGSRTFLTGPGRVAPRGRLSLGHSREVLPVLTLSALVFARHLPTGLWIGLLLLQLVVTSPKRAVVQRIVASVSSMEGGFSRFAEMLALVETEALEAPLLRQCRARMSASGASATREMSRLAQILSFVGARENAVFRLIAGPLLLWDLNCAIALEKWRLRAGTHARAWLSSLGEIEALSSLAALAHDCPEFAWPVLADTPRLAATELGHPLIAARSA